MSDWFYLFQARVSKQQQQPETESEPPAPPALLPGGGGEPVEPQVQPAAPCYPLPAPYCPVYPPGQYPPFVAPPQPQAPASTAQPPVSSQSKNITQILAMPPPPPPPSPYTEPGWQFLSHPGQGLLFSPVMAQVPQVWPHHPPVQWSVQTPPAQKRKMEEYLPAQVSNYNDVENQTIKRQKV